MSALYLVLRHLNLHFLAVYLCAKKLGQSREGYLAFIAMNAQAELA